MKKILLFATAVAAIASCSDQEFVGGEEMAKENALGAISFGFDVPMPTRAGGADAATALGNQFIVYGEKGTITAAAPAAGNLVFPNYQVNWGTNSAYTTTSNTKGWEYVGYTHSTEYQTNITRKASSEEAAVGASSSPQTIKYWDYDANNYIFTAVSAPAADITAGRVKIQKNEYGTTAYDKGYTLTLTKTAGENSDPDVYPDLDKLFASDRKVIAKSAGTDRDAKDAYGGYVEMTFRSLLSQVRAGVYETIPGYAIKEIKFYVSDDEDNDTDPEYAGDNIFGAICPNTKVDANFEGTLDVTYYDDSYGVLENQPNVTVTSGSSPSSDLILGSNFNLSTDNLLGTTSTAPTWDTSGGGFTKVMPQVTNSTPLTLTVDFTLWNSVTGETIEIKKVTATVPAVYLQWKSNYKYTYLFKITDDKLRPIAFDAVQIDAGDGNVEYITTVSDPSNPSITTYAKASAVTTNNEYTTGATIYIVVNDGTTALTVSTNANLYTAEIEAGAAQEITEETVKNAIASTTQDGFDIGEVLENGTDLADYYTYDATNGYLEASGTANGSTTYYKKLESGSYSVKDANGKKLVVKAATGLEAITSIPAEDAPDGKEIAIKGAKFTAGANQYYVFEYIVDGANKHYKVIKINTN